MMKLTEVTSMFEGAFNLVMTDLNPLFKRAINANYSTQHHSKLSIWDPVNIAIKGRPRERRIKSGVEKNLKNSKKSKKAENKTSEDTSAKENGKRPIKK